MTDLRNTGIVTVTFDDALLSQFENGFPVLRELGIRGVVFVPTGSVGGHFSGEPMMSLCHLRQMAAEGWEIGSHSVSHTRLAGRDGLTKVPPAAIDSEARESRAWLIANGFPGISFAYPNGRYNAEVEAIVARYYRFVRTTGSGLNEISPQNTQLKAFDLCQRKIEMWKAAVDAACASAKWLVVMVHGIVKSQRHGGDADRKFQITTDALAACLEYALSVGLQPRTFHEVSDALTGVNGSPQTIYRDQSRARSRT
jgi:peptidoglycan/xylan/chitin deacetylase (PgdA/CDA1 family)